jgi:hypothetical protein
MSNIEFISAKDLPTTESNEVDVLCVENGELKRKAGASLGGGKLFVLRPEDEYLADTGIFVNPELYEECEKQINGESVCSVIYNYEGEMGLTSEIGSFFGLFSFGGITIVAIETWNKNLTICKTTEDADALMNSGE